MAKRLIGSATTTDANGLATQTYTGTGLGKVYLVAESEGLVSRPFPFYDALFKDTLNRYILQGTDMAKKQESNGVLLSIPSGTGGVYFRKKGENTNYNYTPPFIFEVDIVWFDSQSNPNIQCYDQTTTINRTFSQLGITGACHLKVEYGATSSVYYVDGEKRATLNSACSNASRIYINSITSLKVNNPIIYAMR